MRSAQPNITMEVSASEMHRPGRADLVQPKITVNLQVRGMDSREPGAVEGQCAEPGFGQDDGLVEDAVAQGDGMLDSRIAQVQRAGNLGAAERQARVIARAGLSAQDLGDHLGTHRRSARGETTFATSLPVRTKIDLPSGAESVP